MKIYIVIILLMLSIFTGVAQPKASVGVGLALDYTENPGVNIHVTTYDLVLDIDYFNKDSQDYMIGYRFHMPKVALYPLIGVKIYNDVEMKDKYSYDFNAGMGAHYYFRKDLFFTGKFTLNGISIGVGIKLW